MLLFKILINSLNSCSLLFLLQWSSLYIHNSLSELNFAIIPLKAENTTKCVRHLPNTIKINVQQSIYIMKKSLYFIYYKNGKEIFQNSPGFELSNRSHSYIANSCLNEKISFIFHGWTESCYTEWISQLQERLTFHRGGCIVCVDYSSWSKQSYIQLLQKFDLISAILYEEVLQLIQIGFNPNKMFMFGFSYGGQIASKIGRRLKPKYNLKKIDTCDMAGPGFDFLGYLNHSEAAENVQCYYSSLDKGSHFYSCHQNIRLGQCGYTQPAILSQPYFSSHGLCVRIYINAFDFPFYAIQKAGVWCERRKATSNLSYEFTVGYKESEYRNFNCRNINGDIYVPTSLNYPYNLSKKQIMLYEKYLEGA